MQVLLSQLSRESRRVLIHHPHRIAMANDVRPQHHVFPSDVAPQDIESFMPVIELLVIGRLKTGAA